MDFQEILYAVDGPLAVITLNVPQYKNAQGYRMLDEIDAAFDRAQADKNVRVLIIRGSNGNFSTGHDLGSPEATAYREALGAAPGIETYDQFRKYNLDLLLKWRNFTKPSIAMVEGYCIYAKLQMNKAQDRQGFTQSLEDSFGDYFAMMNLLTDEWRVPGEKRLASVDLAVKGRKGERFGLKK